MKALVVYYARNEAMHAVARAVAAELDADIDAIVERLELTGCLGWRRRPVGPSGRLDRVDQARDPTQYDVVVVGTPVRDRAIAVPIADFLAEDGRKVRALAFFCSTVSVGGALALSSMARSARRAPIAALAVTSADAGEGRLGDLARGFASELRAGAARIGRDPAMGNAVPGALWLRAAGAGNSQG